MKVYVIGNLKGGVGKTTTTVNLAYTYAEMGGRTLVIDLDPQCNCTRFFAKVNEYNKTIKDVLEAPEHINSAIYRTKYEDIDIIKGSVKTLEQKSPWSLKEALGYIKKEYDVCLIDTRPVFDVLTKNALYAADVLLTPVKFDNFCRDNLAMVEDAYHELKKKIRNWNGRYLRTWWQMSKHRKYLLPTCLENMIIHLCNHVSAGQRLLITHYLSTNQ